MSGVLVQFQSCANEFVRNHPIVLRALAAVGTYCVATYVFSFLKLLADILVVPGTSLKKFGAKKGRWAVVTGATDGIGKEFALQLGKAGFNVFIASRTASKLADVAQEIESQYNVKTKYHAIDFSKSDPAAYDALAASISGLDVGVLVNNVGKSHDLPTFFHDVPTQEDEDIVEINVNATLKVTKIVLPLMMAKKNGLILNIGSFAGMVPSPMLATYSGSKAFLYTWSEALAEEYKSQGITVQLVNTFFVISSMSKISRPTIAVPTAKVFVRSALSKIGVPSGAINVTATSTPYWYHGVANWLIKSVNWPSYFITYTLNLHKDIRRRALRKREREALKAQ